MRKLFTSLAAVAALLSPAVALPVLVPSTVAVAQAEAEDTATFLTVVRANPSITGTDRELVITGRAICSLKRDEGWSDYKLARALVANGDVADLYDGGYLVGAATSSLCPEVEA